MFKKQNFFSILIYISIFSFFIYLIFLSLNSAIYVPTFHLDGAFQTASGLFRLNDGQLPGKDFFPYLGIGPTVLIFPFFKIAGGNLTASVFAANFVTLLLWWFSLSVLSHFIFRPKKIIFSFVIGAIIFFVVNTFMKNIGADVGYPFLLAFEPGNSLRPIRAALPYLIAIVSYFLLSKDKVGFKRDISISTILALSLLWSNDFALPTTGLFLFFYILFFYFKEKNTWKRSSVTILFFTPIIWFALLSLITIGHPLSMLKYNFIDVAMDQWWYFALYGEENRIFSIYEIGKLFSKGNLFPIIMLVVAFLWALVNNKIESYFVLLIGIILFAGGVVASIGGHLGHYFSGFYWWGILTSLLVLLNLLTYLLSSLGNIKLFFIKNSYVVGSISIFFTIVGAVQVFDYKKNLTYAENNSEFYYVDELGGYLGVGWKDYLHYASTQKDKKIFEEYWGVFSASINTFPTWPVDALIHALGDVRDNAIKELKNADIIVTTRYSLARLWQPWNVSQNFWLYDELFSNWLPEFVSPTTIVWKKIQSSRVYKKVSCHVLSDGKGFVIDSTEGFYKVKLNYILPKGKRYLFMVQNNISYGADANGYVSLKPMSTEATIPVFVSDHGSRIFQSKMLGEKNANFEITSCLAEKIPLEYSEVLYPNYFYLTDDNWERGVARRWAGFFVPNTNFYRENFRVGKNVRFTNGDERKIIETQQNGIYLNIYVDGKVLEASRVGVPYDYSIIDNH